MAGIVLSKTATHCQPERNRFMLKFAHLFMEEMKAI